MTRKSTLTLLLAAALAVMTAAIAAAQSSNEAALVVRFGDDRVETRCVAFEEEQISGYELLERSGLPLDVGDTSFGASVCRIDDVGCAARNCFCECQGGSCTYWSYWHLRNGNWQYSSAGATAYQVQDGNVDGWSWGPGSVSEAPPPPQVTFEEICAEEDDPSPSPAAATAGSDAADPTAQAAVVSPAATSQVTDGAAASGAGPDASQGAFPWSYAVFAAIIVLLAGAIVLVQRRG